MLSDYLPVLFVFLLAAGFAVASLGVTHLVGPRIKDTVKESVYESGLDPVAEIHSRVNIRYFIVGLIFVIFDIEIVFLFPWAVVYRGFLAEGLFILVEMLFFLAILSIGFVYIWRKGVFEWE